MEKLVGRILCEFYADTLFDTDVLKRTETTWNLMNKALWKVSSIWRFNSQFFGSVFSRVYYTVANEQRFERLLLFAKSFKFVLILVWAQQGSIYLFFFYIYCLKIPFTYLYFMLFLRDISQFITLTVYHFLEEEKIAHFSSYSFDWSVQQSF